VLTTGARLFRRFSGIKGATTTFADINNFVIMVDHENRKRLILDKSLELFVQRGYADVTFQNIAEQCGVSRTTIYKYFENKRQIFSYTIRQLIDGMDEPFRRVANDESMTTIEKLRQVMNDVVSLLIQQNSLLKVIMDYLLIEKQVGAEIQRKIERYTIGMRFLLERLIQKGIDRGEFSSETAEKVGDLLYSILESTILRLIVLERADRREIAQEVDYLLHSLTVMAQQNETDDD
jgi:AcrR family transcriptional regulator